MTKKSISLFIDLALAVIKGDDAEATAIKIQRTSIAVLTAQIAAKVLHTMMLEENILAAKEKLQEARVNSGSLIADHTTFVKNLLITNQKLKEAEDILAAHKEEVAFLQAELEIAKS